MWSSTPNANHPAVNAAVMSASRLRNPSTSLNSRDNLNESFTIVGT